MVQNAAEKLPCQLWLSSPRQVRPFLKWAGGKSQLLAEILERCPARYNRYFEPFVGGGAVLFALRPKKAYISDINADLINAYKVVKSRVENLITHLKRHVYEHDYYYKLRDADRTPTYKKWSVLARASRLIYLNKTCYNGLYRVNASGHFNTPFGRYSAPKIVDAANLRACSKALRGVNIRCAAFAEIESLAGSEDFVYFDPPYVPLSSTANFTNYSKGGFDQIAQRELSLLCKRLDKKGVQFLLSNSGTTAVRGLYRGFRQEHVWATRAVNSVGGRRGAIKELLISNF